MRYLYIDLKISYLRFFFTKNALSEYAFGGIFLYLWYKKILFFIIDNNIKLLRFWESDIKKNPDLVISRLKEIL